ncbi:MAG: hypothetical protein ABIJ35_00375 [Acidobacteriota bacterium]
MTSTTSKTGGQGEKRAAERDGRRMGGDERTGATEVREGDD